MRSFLFPLLLLCTLATLHAQPDDRWRTFPTEGTPNPMRHYFPANGAVGYSSTGSTVPLLRYISPTALYEYWAVGPTCFTCDTVPGWRSNDGGATWQSIHGATMPYRFEMRGNVGIARSWSFERYNLSAHITTTGDDGWHTLKPFPDETANEVSYDTIPADGTLPRIMVARYANWRLSITTDGGATWNHIDSIGYTLDGTGKPIDSGLVASTLFGPAPVDTNGYFRWVRTVGLEGTTLTLLSTNKAGSTISYSLWKVNLSTMSSTVRPMASDTAALVVGSQPAFPGTLMSLTDGRANNVVLALSYDLGNTWERRNDSVRSFSKYDTYRTLRWASPSTIFTLDQYSTDTGRTWHRWYAPFRVFDIDFADSLHLAAAGPDGVYISSDAGRTWKSAWADAPHGVSASKGIVIAQLRSTGFSVSHDSAEHWTPMVLPENIDKIDLVIPFDTANDPNHLLAIVTDDTFDSGAVRSLIESVDRGATWSLVGRTLQFDNVTIGQARVLQTGDVRSRTIYLATSGGFYVSSDRGRSWDRRSSLSFSMLSMFDPLHGVAGNKASLVYTADGGTTWTSRGAVGIGFVAFDSLRYTTLFVDAQQLSSKGKVAYTFDGGLHWEERVSQSNDVLVLDPLYWIDPAQVYCTTLGRILFSSDSGRHFDNLYPGLSLAADAALFDGSYLYYFSPDSAKIGRWRVTEKPSGVRGETVGSGGLAVRTEGSRIIVVPEGPLPERSQPALVDMLGRPRELAWNFDGRNWSAECAALPSGRYIITVVDGGVQRQSAITLVR